MTSNRAAHPSTKRHQRLGALAALAAGSLLAAGHAPASDHAATIQWFELSWNNMERRMPDFFVAGYGSVWLPPPWKGASLASVGYDLFDRFDLGSPTSQTMYGTENDFVALVDEYHRANGLVYIDTIMNHNSGRTSDAGFIAAGGWPGFWEENATPGAWGDFHDGTTQSENPGAPNYDLWEGDLVALIDIDQDGPYTFIRHPVDPANPANIPNETPAESNTRFYPDLDLPPKSVFNPASGQTLDIHPFNTSDPTAGDPTLERPRDLLMRSSQWMLDVFKVDGFRLDAAKHIEPGFWRDYWDAAVHERREAPDGSFVNPVSFGESVAGNDFVFNNYVRKDAFADRDALDLNGAGQARNVINARGFAAWIDILNAHIDNEDDGFNNGTVGWNHVYSHDNGSAGDGGSLPPLPADDKVGLHVWAYMLMRPGPVIVYHNAREMHARFPNTNRFSPREGNPTALGLAKDLVSLDDNLTELVQLRNEYARGEFDVLTLGSDVMVFQRRTNLGGNNYVGNVLVGVNDRYDTGFDTRVVFTSFPQGTRLHELTGNAADPVVDPGNNIPEVITVGANGQVSINVPRNAQASGETHKGYVVYGPATPSGTLAIAGADSVIPPDATSISSFLRRLTEIDYVTAPTFEIDLDTVQTDPQDPQTDDLAIYRIGQGFEDYNGNGNDGLAGEFAAYENFLTENNPLFTTGIGRYRQTINTDDLPEGYNYISVVAFRNRASGDPLYNEWRRVIYVDREEPPMELVAPQIDCATGTGTLRVRNLDKTATNVWVFIDLPDGAPLPPLTSNDAAFRFDRSEWLFSVSGLTGDHSATIVAQERPRAGFVANTSVTRVEFSVGDNLLRGDVNMDGKVDADDLYAFEQLSGFQCEADVATDFVIDAQDEAALRALVRDNETDDVTTRD